MANAMTDPQARIYQCIRTSHAAMTIAEIARRTGRSVMGVRDDCFALKAQGHITSAGSFYSIARERKVEA